MLLEQIKLTAMMDRALGNRQDEPFDDPDENAIYQREWERLEQQFESQEL